MIDWTKVLPIDNRSKQSIGQQVANNFVLLIQNQILGESQSLPTIQALADNLNIDTQIITQAYDFLIHHDYIYRYGDEVKVSESELLQFELPKPFTPNLISARKTLKLLEIETMESKVVETPEFFKQRFGETYNQKAVYTKRIYQYEGKNIAMIESYYFMVDVNDPLTKEQFSKEDETTRELTVLQAAEEHHKIFGKNHNHIAKDFYIIKRKKHTVIEFGQVYTIINHTFTRTLTNADFLFIF